MELMFYPFMASVLLTTYLFLAGEGISETMAAREILEASDSAIGSSNLVLLNCSIDHHLMCVPEPGKGSYYIRRLATDGKTVKELIFPAAE